MEVDSTLIEDFKFISRENLEFNKKCATLAQEINSGQLTIVQLVEQLGTFLVDVSPDNRELGTWILTQVLEKLAPDYLNVTQLNFICTFYADRLKDHHQVIPAVLCGILSLAKFKPFPDGAASQLLTALFHNVACQQQQEGDRYRIYSIFEVLLERSTTELCSMGLDYVYGVMSAVDGERNPRNLMFLFRWFPTFLATVNLGHLSEEMFEVLSCYFPIDFKAPPQDTNNVTREMLANALAPCLTAIPDFAEFCFTLALEKLDSSLEIAKLDSLNLLKIGCSTFDVSSYIQHSTEMWSQLQRELFNRPNAEVESACLSTLTAIIAKFSNDARLIAIVKDITDTVKGNLLPDSKLFEASSKLLHSVARASQASCSLTAKEVVPVLVNTFKITRTPAHQTAVLKTLVDFYSLYMSLHDQVECEELCKVPVFCLQVSIDETSILKITGLDGLTQISQTLPCDLRFSIYNNLQTLFLSPQSEEVRCSALKCLEKLAEKYPLEVKEKFIDVIRNGDKLGSYFCALSIITPQEHLTDHVINIFLECTAKETSLAQLAINSLSKLLNQHVDNVNIETVMIGKNVVNILIDWGVAQGSYVDRSCLENLAFVVKSLIGIQTSDKQKEIVNRNLVRILSLSTSTDVFIFLIDGLLCRLYLDVDFDYNILHILTEIICKNDDDIAGKVLANLINKCTNDVVLQTYLDSCQRTVISVPVVGWVTKALMMRNHPSASAWTYKMIDLLLEDPKVAIYFSIVMNDNYDDLGEKSHCVKTLLYQQKFFTIVRCKLSEKYQPECYSYLLAFGYLLQHAPRQVVVLQFPNILKLIVLCLDNCCESKVLMILLETLKDFLVCKDECLMEYFSIFLQRFLKLSSFPNSMKVRILALQCVQLYTITFPIFKLLPYKEQVLAVLAQVIDDKKRIVRREAVEARTQWFLLDAPT